MSDDTPIYDELSEVKERETDVTDILAVVLAMENEGMDVLPHNDVPNGDAGQGA